MLSAPTTAAIANGATRYAGQQITATLLNEFSAPSFCQISFHKTFGGATTSDYGQSVVQAVDSFVKLPMAPGE